MTEMTECETCGYDVHDVHDDNPAIECACGEVLCGECIHEHNEGCNEYVASANDKWGPTTPASRYWIAK